MRADDPLISRSEAVALVGVALGLGTAIDGVLLSVIGTSDLFPAVSPGPSTWAVIAAGAVVAVAGASSLGARLPKVIRSVTPRLYPYAAAGTSAAIFLVLLVSAVAVYAGFFEMFVGAHDNGDFTSVGDQATLSVLIDLATGLLWVATAYAILLVRRMVGIGRYLESSHQDVDAYGGGIEGSTRPAPPTSNWTDAPLAGGVARSTRYAVAIGLAFFVAMGIQVAEIGLAPASAGDWLTGQVFLPAMPLAVTAGAEAIDRGVRELERRFARQWAAVPAGVAPVPVLA